MLADSERRVLEGVNRVAWGEPMGYGEFAMCVVSLLRYLGEEVDHSYVTAVSGSAFRMFMPNDPWNPSGYHVANNPDIPIHTFLMLGYEVSQHPKGAADVDTRRIMSSIDRGIPVITLEGVVNCADCCIITGYDSGGDVLLGWSNFQSPPDHTEEPDVTGYFRKTGWHAAWNSDRPYYYIVGERVGRPPEAEVYRETLALAARLIRGTVSDGGCSGRAAYAAFAKALLSDDFGSSENGFFMAHLTILCNHMMYSDKKRTVDFLASAAECMPEHRGALTASAQCYRQIGDLCDELETVVADFSEESAKALKDYATRERYAAIVCRIRDLETEAAQCFEAVAG